MKKLYIYGSGGHSLVCADIAQKCSYTDIEFIDDFKDGFKSLEDIKDNTDIPFFVAIGNNTVRKELFDTLKKNSFQIISLVDPSAVIAKNVTLGEGCLIMPNVVLNTQAKIGDGVILNTSCVIEHENIIENFVHISPSVSLAGNVIVKANTHIGIGSVSIQGISIGQDCIIGAGSVIVKNIPDNVKAYGNPCKIVEEI